MGRGGDNTDGTNPLYDKMQVRRPERPERARGICGELQAAGIYRLTETFQIWEDDAYSSGDMEDLQGRPVENDDLGQKVGSFLERSLRDAFPGYLFDGMSGRATFDVRKETIDVDLHESFTRDEAYPWSDDLPQSAAKSMERAGAEIAEVTFDGYGDSGSVNGIDLYRRPETDGEAPERITFLDEKEDLEKKLAAEKELTDFVYDQLESRQGGWENNEGAFGVVRIELGKMAKFDFNYRVEDTRQHQVTMDPVSGECELEKSPAS